jgi:hypothetical protein
MTNKDFASLFTDLRVSPLDIEAGADIVLWYSTTVQQRVTATVTAAASKSWFGRTPSPITRTFQASPTGRLFIHGIFFAHEAERSSATTGTRDPIHRPASEKSIRSAPRWFRPPG